MSFTWNSLLMCLCPLYCHKNIAITFWSPPVGIDMNHGKEVLVDQKFKWHGDTMYLVACSEQGQRLSNMLDIVWSPQHIDDVRSGRQLCAHIHTNWSNNFLRKAPTTFLFLYYKTLIPTVNFGRPLHNKILPPPFPYVDWWLRCSNRVLTTIRASWRFIRNNALEQGHCVNKSPSLGPCSQTLSFTIWLFHKIIIQIHENECGKY